MSTATKSPTSGRVFQTSQEMHLFLTQNQKNQTVLFTARPGHLIEAAQLLTKLQQASTLEIAQHDKSLVGIIALSEGAPPDVKHYFSATLKRPVPGSILSTEHLHCLECISA